jgi:hypothetical protein
MTNGQDEAREQTGVIVECQEDGCAKNPLFRVIIGKHGTLLVCDKCGQGYSSPESLPLRQRKAIVKGS